MLAEQDRKSLSVPRAGASRPEHDDSPSNPVDFRVWVQDSMTNSPLYTTDGYASLIDEAIEIICELRERFWENERTTWIRLIKRGKILKEFNEVIPIAYRVRAYVKTVLSSNPSQALTILDLCSGIGYLSILLSELLNRDYKRSNNNPNNPNLLDNITFVLIDKSFPQLNQPTQKHHINPEHLTQNLFPGRMKYRKYDLKATSSLRQLQKHILDPSLGPICVLGIYHIYTYIISHLTSHLSLSLSLTD